jgi:hypothetical protein
MDYDLIDILSKKIGPFVGIGMQYPYQVLLVVLVLVL